MSHGCHIQDPDQMPRGPDEVPNSRTLPAAGRLFAVSRHRVVPALARLGAGVFCTIAPHLDRTLGRPLRAHGGDLALAMFLFLGAGAITTVSRRVRGAAVLVLLWGIELSQLVRSLPRGGLLTELTIGSTFDPIDLAAFVVGVGAAVWIERWVDGKAG
jgi:hypothetical protein